jgi:hypothetical protein
MEKRIWLTLLAAGLVLSELKAQIGVGPGFGPLPVPSWTCGRDIPSVPGLIYNEWMRIGGPTSSIGCPVANFVQDAPDGSGYQQFDHGQIAVSPGVWIRGVVAAYQTSGDGVGSGAIVVDWIVDWNWSPVRTPPPSSPPLPCCNYDKFLVRWNYNRAYSDHANYPWDSQHSVCDDNHASGDGDQCDIIANMSHNQLFGWVVNYQTDTHLRNMGTFTLSPPDHPDGFYQFMVEGCDQPSIGSSSCKQGWMHPVTVGYKQHGIDVDEFSVDLKSVPSAHTVAESRASYIQRAAAIVLHNACQLLPHTYYNNDQYGIIILAKLEYANYYNRDMCPGRPIDLRQEAFDSLRQQIVEQATGTSVTSGCAPIHQCRTGEYDFVLANFIPMVFKFGSILPADVKSHIINDLLDKHGPFEADDFVVDTFAPETENHLNAIESSRYLTNDILFQQTNNPQDNNATNGLKAWWLQRLHDYLVRDFIEYNARPYQRYTDEALQNLAAFAVDPQVRTASKMVLDYISAKMAASQNNARRVAPFRRLAGDDSHNLIGFQDDQQSARNLVMAGNLDILLQSGT